MLGSPTPLTSLPRFHTASALCLYDPDGGQWDPRMLIADTTIPWAADWLKFYEFWLYDGIWRGKSVGPESAAKIRA